MDMEVRKFNNWVCTRENRLDEGIGDWFSKLFGANTPNQPQSAPPDPAEIEGQIYKNPIVIKYSNEILSHLNIQPGVKFQRIDNNNMPIPRSVIDGGDIGKDPQFYKALQRFVAGHILGKGREKAFLRISHHDAIIIIQTLDKYAQIVKGQNLGSIVDEFQIGNPISLSTWLQPKVPVAPDAITQHGYDQGSSEFSGRRVERTGKGNPLSIPYVKKVVDAGVNVIANKKTKTANSRIGSNLWNALETLEKALSSVPNSSAPTTPPPAPSSKSGRKGPGKRKRP